MRLRAKPRRVVPKAIAHILSRIKPMTREVRALPDAGTALLRAVRANFAPFAGFVLEHLNSRRWASVTFRGARHSLAFRLEGEGAENEAGRFLSNLMALCGTMRGHLMANVHLVSEERRTGFARIEIEALTVEDA